MSSDKTEVPPWVSEVMEQALQQAPTSFVTVETAEVFLFTYEPNKAEEVIERSQIERPTKIEIMPLLPSNDNATGVILLRVPKTERFTYGYLDWRRGFCAMTSIEQLAVMCGGDLSLVAIEAHNALLAA